MDLPFALEKFVRRFSDFLTCSLFAELIPVWTMTSFVLSEAHAFSGFTMADKPQRKSIRSPPQSHTAPGILKIQTGVASHKVSKAITANKISGGAEKRSVRRPGLYKLLFVIRPGRHDEVTQSCSEPCQSLDLPQAQSLCTPGIPELSPLSGRACLHINPGCGPVLQSR